MIINYLKSVFRSIKNQMFFTFINIAGLSIGITVCILATLYMIQDLNFDNFHKNAGQIYRVHFSTTQSGEKYYEAKSPALLGAALQNKYPEIKKNTRIYFPQKTLVETSGKKYFESRVSYADPSFFEIFTFETILGNKKQFLKKENTIILTEAVSKKYFGNINPIGKLIELNNKNIFEVTGVIKDVPENSHFKFDFLATYSSLQQQPEEIYLNQWGATFSYTYLLTEKGFKPKVFEKKTENFFAENTPLRNGKDWRVLLTPLKEIHLNSHLPDEIEENSSYARIIIVGSIAFFVLVLACINFVNLSIARSTKRAVEIGIRKILGAFRVKLIIQFLSESVLISFFALIISFVLVSIFIPYFSSIMGSTLEFGLVNNWFLVLIISFVVLVIGIIAGIYPAFIISAYPPIKVVKGNVLLREGKKNQLTLRKGLIILQFTISIVLITGTIVINKQYKYLCEYDMGFDKQYMLVIPVNEDINKNYETIKNVLNDIPGVLSSTTCEKAPLGGSEFETECIPGGLGTKESFIINVNAVDFNYMNHFGIKMLAGRNITKEFQNDYSKAMLINKKMALRLGFHNIKDAVGKSYFISINGYKPEIIGVVDDFNSSSLHNELKPQVFMYKPEWFSEFVVKINSTSISSTIKRIEEVWSKFFPQYPFEYHFLDEIIDKMYKSEEKYSSMILIFSSLSIFIACLGLLGLTSFMLEQSRKEIGIRKILGASIPGILNILSKEFLRGIIISILLACPLSYYLMDKWLQNFVYRTEISIWVFIAAGLIAIIIAMLTVGFQSYKTAALNPIDSIKYE